MEQRRGADQGIDGRLYFPDERRGGHTKQIILSVKSGHVSVTDVRELRAVVKRERAADWRSYHLAYPYTTYEN